MAGETKIGKLREALKSGENLSPLTAWLRWQMNSSTYHRCIWELQHKDGLQVMRRMVTEDNGIRHSVHWLNITGAPVGA
jgi:Trm5-related predicted tRNA methylase